MMRLGLVLLFITNLVHANERKLAFRWVEPGFEKRVESSRHGPRSNYDHIVHPDRGDTYRHFAMAHILNLLGLGPQVLPSFVRESVGTQELPVPALSLIHTSKVKEIRFHEEWEKDDHLRVIELFRGAIAFYVFGREWEHLSDGVNFFKTRMKRRWNVYDAQHFLWYDGTKSLNDYLVAIPAGSFASLPEDALPQLVEQLSLFCAQLEALLNGKGFRPELRALLLAGFRGDEEAFRRVQAPARTRIRNLRADLIAWLEDAREGIETDEIKSRKPLPAHFRGKRVETLNPTGWDQVRIESRPFPFDSYDPLIFLRTWYLGFDRFGPDFYAGWQSELDMRNSIRIEIEGRTPVDVARYRWETSSRTSGFSDCGDATRQ